HGWNSTAGWPSSRYTAVIASNGGVQPARPRQPSSTSTHTSARPRTSAGQLGEERGDVARDQLRLLGRGEMPSPLHRRPALHVIEALRPLARRFTLRDELVVEDGDGRRHGDPVVRAEPVAVEPVVVVVAQRLGDRPAGPVDGEQGEQEVAAEG